MEPLFSLENCYIIQVDQYDKWVGVYHSDGHFYSLGYSASRFNHARDKVREVYTARVGLPRYEAVDLSENRKLDNPEVLIRDCFRVTNGNRVCPDYVEGRVCIKPSDGYSPEEILQMDDARVKEISPDKPDAAIETLQRVIADTQLSAELPSTTSAGAAWALNVDGSLAINNAMIEAASVDVSIGSEDPLAEEAAKYSAYWKPLPKNWRAIDTYRVDVLFPLNDSRLTHARKKLLVPGTRTGGKSFRHDIKEAWATLGQWLKDNPED